MKNKVYKFAFVILNYLTIEDTIECVNSIINNIDYPNYKIVIVDNGSPNGSGAIIKERFNTHDKITVILNKKNLGFAKGNNIGFQHAKYRLKADFIALINNDTIIEQSNFISKIIEKFKSTNFHILGPDIISIKNGLHQSPMPLKYQNKNLLKSQINLYSIKLILNYFLLDNFLEKLKKSFIKTPFVQSGPKTGPSWTEEKKNVKLHGSVLIFSPLYIELYEGLYPKTFMFMEEAILYFIAHRDKLATVYCPDIKILHKEDSSIDEVYKKDYKKRRFTYKYFIKSSKELLKLMEKSE